MSSPHPDPSWRPLSQTKTGAQGDPSAGGNGERREGGKRHRGSVGGWKKGRKGGGERERSGALWMGKSLSLQTQLERTRSPQSGKPRSGESGHKVTPSRWPRTSAQSQCTTSLVNSGPFHRCGGPGATEPKGGRAAGCGAEHRLSPSSAPLRWASGPCSAATLALPWRLCRRAPS